jgi:hypothetical protein
MKLRKPRHAKTASPESKAKARLRNLGNGTLEFNGSVIKFYVEKGRVKKQKETAREISIADIEGIERVGNEFTITWKGTTDAFVTEKAELVEAIYAKVTEALNEKRQIVEDKEATKQKQNEFTKILSVAIEIVDPLFDILRSLHGRIDWNRVEDYSKRSVENVRNFTNLTAATTNLEFTKLSSAIKEHLPREISKETYSVLKLLYEYFNGLTAKTESPEQTHPNYNDAKTTILAYYTLNDVILGTVVGDEEIVKESNALVAMLEDLSKVTDLKIDVAAVKDVINNLVMEKGKESVIEESRALFRQQLKELITA